MIFYELLSKRHDHRYFVFIETVIHSVACHVRCKFNYNRSPLWAPDYNNRLLTEREGQYSPVRPEQARLVSGLLYGTVSDSKMQWRSVSDNKMQLQKRFVTESDKSSC